MKLSKIFDLIQQAIIAGTTYLVILLQYDSEIVLNGFTTTMTTFTTTM